jgi:hypothetical protein
LGKERVVLDLKIEEPRVYKKKVDEYFLLAYHRYEGGVSSFEDKRVLA